jgi:hypothetical protein
MCDDHNTNACGTCGANCSQKQLALATGSITIVSVNNIRDAIETITLDDGVNPFVIFEFDKDGTFAPGNVRVPYATFEARAERNVWRRWS